MVADSEHLDLAKQLHLPVLNLDDVLAGEHFPDVALNVALSMEGEYSVNFTSGSTGASKGVASSKKGRIVAARRQIELMKLGIYDRYAHLGNPNFAGPQILICSLLLSGAAIHLLDVSARGISGLGQWIDEMGITIFHPTTGIFRQCSPQMSMARLDTLRLVRTGADKRVRSYFELFQQYYPAHCQFQIGFGTSETGSVASMFFQPDDEIEGDQLPAGYVNAPEECMFWTRTDSLCRQTARARL